MTAISVILVRHAESVHNVQNVWAGSLDSELTNHGINQTKRIADELKLRPVTHIFSSGSIRAKRSALAIAEYHPNAQFTVMQNLRERDLGSLEGLSYRSKENTSVSKSHGESKEKMTLRAQEAWQNILSDMDVGHREAMTCVVIMSHGLFLSGLMQVLTARYSTGTTDRYSWSNTGYTELVIDESGNMPLKILNTNSTSHLRGLKRVKAVGSSSYDTKQMTLDSFMGKV